MKVFGLDMDTYFEENDKRRARIKRLSNPKYRTRTPRFGGYLTQGSEGIWPTFWAAGARKHVKRQTRRANRRAGKVDMREYQPELGEFNVEHESRWLEEIYDMLETAHIAKWGVPFKNLIEREKAFLEWENETEFDDYDYEYGPEDYGDDENESEDCYYELNWFDYDYETRG